jgi:PIN domain nuclease of toxin-antitoxin system
VKYLLDTQVFLWWASDSKKLSPRALLIIKNPSHQLLLSVASIWEMQIKTQLGHLPMAEPLKDTVAKQKSNGIQLLPVYEYHVYYLTALPHHHKDPFDRMLIAQANAEQIPLISADGTLGQYPVTLIW